MKNCIILLFFICGLRSLAQTMPVLPVKKDYNKPISTKTKSTLIEKQSKTDYAKQSPNSTTLKILCDADAILYIDGKLKGNLRAGNLLRTNLIKGDYLIKAVSKTNFNDYVEQQYSINKNGTQQILQLSLAQVINAKIITDIDGNRYNYVKIGSQIWATKNLDVSHFRNGDPIPEIEDANEWKKAGEDGRPAWCYYNGDPANRAYYQKLYNWYAVTDQRGLAPTGCHIPTRNDWDILVTYLGNYNVAGGKMKSSSGWNENGNGRNESGFSGYPGGERYLGEFKDTGITGEWWSSSEGTRTDIAFTQYLYYFHGGTNYNDMYKSDGHSVRFIKD